MQDKIIVKGLNHLDGEYPFDIAKLMLSPGDPEFMTYREWHELKVMSGVRAGEVIEALDAGDTDVNLAVVAIVLRRAGKFVDVDELWDAPGTAEIRMRLGKRELEEDASLPPLSEPPTEEPSGSQPSNGGESLRPTLVSPGTVPSRIGALGAAISSHPASVS